VTSPEVFFSIRDSQLPPHAKIVHDNSNGDECHFDIMNLTEGESRTIWKQLNNHSLFVCNAERVASNIPADTLEASLAKVEID
jgi:hypothetical protein